MLPLTAKKFLLSNQHHCSLKHTHHNTFRELIGISPSGSIIFVSGLWDGRVSERVITAGCGIIELLKPGYNVMADQEFDIQYLLGAKKIELIHHLLSAIDNVFPLIK